MCRVATSLERIVAGARETSGNFDPSSRSDSEEIPLDEDRELIGERVVASRAAGQSFVRARFVDVELVRCDLAGCDFSDASLQRVQLVDCRISGGDFGMASLRAVSFVDCRLDDANFRLARVADSRFESSVLARADFGET